MLPRETLATAEVPDGETLTLVSHGRDFVIMLGRDELMGTRMQFSEEQLAVLTLAELDAAKPRVLIGGYGMGVEQLDHPVFRGSISCVFYRP
jgi:spermidine synthase